jgi:transglutaminase-like putative cysteine protease
MRRPAVLPLVAALLLASAGARAGGPPAWLRGAAAEPVPAYDARVPAVVLHQELAVIFEAGGRIRYVTRYAVRVLRREGAPYALAEVPYRADGGRVRSLDAWMLPAAGEPHHYRDRDVVDNALLEGNMYSDLRERVLDASGDALDGAVFGFESERDDRDVFTQFERSFQEDVLPVVRSRIEVTVPEGWRVEGTLVNHEAVPPSVTGREHAWELRDLPAVPYEPRRPPLTELAPRLLVTVYPLDGSTADDAVAFRSWRDASAWMTQHADPSAAATEGLSAKASALAAGAGTEEERIAAVATFVQGLTYASIQLGTSRGEGYVPRPAADVLARGYGDCKDKANLMRALLGTLGIPAYLVPIYSGDRDYVRDVWPSLQQFNHCILAVRITQPFAGPVYADSALGSLVLFDPTDPEVPLGSLPSDEQASLALLVAGSAGGLIRVPSLPDSLDLERRLIEATIGADGSIDARLTDRATGRFAVSNRRAFHGLSRPDFRSLVQRWVARGATGTNVESLATHDERSRNAFTLDLGFRASSYAQVLGPGMLAVRPVVVERGEELVFPEPRRTLPVRLRSAALTETTRLLLPAGFTAEEIPKPLALDAPFGTYRLEVRAAGDTLVTTRSYRMRPGRVPPERYPALRDFCARVHAAEQVSVVVSRH